MDLTRRTALAGGATSAAIASAALLAAPSATAAPQASTARAAAVPRRRLTALGLSDVALGPGLLSRKRDLMLDFGRGYDEQRLLSVFRANAGLPVGDIEPLPAGGWEGLDGEANGNLRGHFGGHFMTMLAQAYASTGEKVFAEKMTAFVEGLRECRDALGRPTPVLDSREGRSGRAVDLARGSYHYLDLPPAAAPTTTAFSLAAWVMPTHDQPWARIWELGKDDRTHLFLAQRAEQGGPRFVLRSDGGAEQRVSAPAPLPVGAWSHVAVTLVGGRLTIYVDGAEAATGAVTLSPAALGSMADHWIGRSHYPDPTLAGRLDRFDLWSRALSAAEVAALAGAAAGTAADRGDLASYDFEDTEGSQVSDASGRGLHGTLRRTWGAPSHPGFLAAYPETQFITLETITEPDYRVVWAPYYTAHKILQGLVDVHTHSDDEATRATALDLATGLCDWMWSRLHRLSATTRQRMWNTFSSGEYGGLPEAILGVYDKTGRTRYLRLAELFTLDLLVDALAEGKDVLAGRHANQHIPMLVNALRHHELTGERRYLDAARNFWPMVAEQRTYSIGGTSLAEFWREPDQIAVALGPTTCETCCAYNMLKLTRLLHLREQDPRYMDYFERVLFNQVLGSKQDEAGAELPLATYFIGVEPGHVRDYTPKRGTTCCEGTGMESPMKYQESAYVTQGDRALHVDLFVPSTLDWEAAGVQVTQTTDFPYEQGTRLRVEGSARFTMRLRRPGWAGPGYAVRINGRRVPVTDTAPGGYVAIDRRWRDGDLVEVAMPFRFRQEATSDDPTLKSLFYGPLNLVALSPATTTMSLSLDQRTRLSGDLVDSLRPVPGTPLHFTVGEVEVAPFFEGTELAYHAYHRAATDKVVVAGVDTGVRNVRGSDGVPLLDALWSAAPYPSKAAWLRRARSVTQGFVDRGALTAADRRTVLEVARRAPLRA